MAFGFERFDREAEPNREPPTANCPARAADRQQQPVSRKHGLDINETRSENGTTVTTTATAAREKSVTAGFDDMAAVETMPGRAGSGGRLWGCMGDGITYLQQLGPYPGSASVRRGCGCLDDERQTVHGETSIVVGCDARSTAGLHWEVMRLGRLLPACVRLCVGD
jgi:hypothetical protein